MKITWQKTEYYEWTGISEDETFVITVYLSMKKWYWTVYKDEDRIIQSWYEDEPHFPDAEQAKAAAEQALQNYLKEKEVV